jgi:hypothetical protein
MSSDRIKLIDLFSIPIDNDGKGMTISLPDLPSGRYGFHILFDLGKYPLSDHLCYMHPKINTKYARLQELRFSEMKFDHSSPGIQVGPWPGWRGIPAMPKIKLISRNQKTEARYNFWGDEFKTGIVRIIAYLLIQRHTNQFISIKWEDTNLRPRFAEIYPCAKQTARTNSVELLAGLKSSYPRLLFSESQLKEIKNRCKKAHGDLWEKIEGFLTNNWSLEFTLTPESKTVQGPERLNDLDRVVLSAFHALMTERVESIERALDTFESALEKALLPDYEPMQIDTQAGECLFSFCVSYDWLFHFLSLKKRTKFQQSIYQLAEKVWCHLGYERDDFGQAHFLGCSHGLLAFSFLFWEEHPRAQEWVTYLFGVFSSVLDMFPNDGFYPHGINLWIYEHTFLLRFLEMFRQCAGINFWEKSEYWQNASLFRLQSLSPDASMAITFGDPQYRVAGDAWMHYLIANRCGSEQAQSLGKLLADGACNGVDFRSVPPRRRVWEYLYYNPNISESESKIQTHYFQDGGQIFIRDKSAKDETLITFRAGAPLGKQRYLWGEWSGYGHSDPCNGGFLIYKGNSFLVNGPGAVYRRDTHLHNTVTIDGRGQIGDGMVWAPEFIPLPRMAKITKYDQHGEMTVIEADLSSAYLDFLCVKKILRRFFYISPGVIIVHDYVQLKKERNIEWNIHSFGDFFKLTDKTDLSFEIVEKNQKIILTCLTPQKLKWETGLTEFVPAYPNPGKRDRFLKLIKKSNVAEFLCLLKLDDSTCHWTLNWDSSKSQWQQLKLNIDSKEFIIENYSTMAA